jgi:hypothetical protein
MGTKAWRTRQLRMTHGLTTATKTMAASVALRSAATTPVRVRRAGQTIQRPQAGRKVSSELLESAISPQSRPKRSHSRVRGLRFEVRGCSPKPRRRKARTRTQEKRNAVSAMSQIHLTAYCMAAG